MKDCNDNDTLFFNKKVNRIWESLGKGATNTGAEFLVFERTIRDATIGSSKFIQEFQSQSGLFSLKPWKAASMSASAAS
jgi:hypothetical protein